MLRRIAPRRTLLGGLLLANLLVFLALYALFFRSHDPPRHIAGHPYFTYDLDASEPRDADQKCVLPRYHPFDPSIWDYLCVPKSIICKERRSDFTYMDEKGWIRFNESEITEAGYYLGSSLYCKWSPVIRPEDDDDKITYGTETLLTASGTNLPSDIETVRVHCTNFFGLSIYDKLHVRIREVSQDDPSTVRPQNPINVLIFGLDSMSRLSFLRLLPLTYKYLTEKLSMTVFRGMNKVGDNTYPNLIPLLTGHKAYGGGLPSSVDQYYDDFPVIWKNFSNAGYATMWAEDFPRFGLFNYLAKGFHKSPTDHYLRPYWLAVEESTLLKHSSYMCYGSQPKYMQQIDYVKRFITTYKTRGKPYFGFSFLAELSHEYLTRVTSADEHFEDFFRFLYREGHLENTVLIVMSDHGHRFDPMRTTQIGHMEERTPFYAMRIPLYITSMQPSLSKTLLINSARLVTPFDVHATLLDILQFARSSHLLGQPGGPPLHPGQSLFREVPADRTCTDANIPAHYCICQSEHAIPVSDVRAQLAAESAVRQVNKMMQELETNSCAVLSLGHVKSAHLVRSSENEDSEPKTKVRVVIIVEPSQGILEATAVVHDGLSDVEGDISRLNPYGNQSDCIRHTILRKYCFCLKPIHGTEINNLNTTKQSM